MQIMNRLLSKLKGAWDTSAKDVPTMLIEQGGGKHSRVTIQQGVLYLHDGTYQENMPVNQSIVLDELTIEELETTLTNMGYAVTVTSEALNLNLKSLQAYIMIEGDNKPLPYELRSYTSPLWVTFYPIYRVLRKAEYDVNYAVQQLYLTTASGEWLDYWADFFGIKRRSGESDNTFIRRILMLIFNPKTNNIAIKELLEYRLGDSVGVNDTEPAVFEVVVDPKYMGRSSDLNDILVDARGAGIHYFLSYFFSFTEEDYKASMADRAGVPFRTIDEAGLGIELLLREGLSEVLNAPTDSYEVTQTLQYFEDFLLDVNSNYDASFTLDNSELDDTNMYDGQPTAEVAVMTMEKNGETVRSIML